MLFFPSVVRRPVVNLVPLCWVNYNQLVVNGPTGVLLIVLLVDEPSKTRLLLYYTDMIRRYCRYLFTFLIVWLVRWRSFSIQYINLNFKCLLLRSQCANFNHSQPFEILPTTGR
jgi:hypothetical protein